LLFTLVLGAQAACDGTETKTERKTATLLSCQGWKLNRLPEVKAWINYDAKCFGDDVSVDYVGGDPRMVFAMETTTICTGKDGVAGEPVVTSKKDPEIDVSFSSDDDITKMIKKKGI